MFDSKHPTRRRLQSRASAAVFACAAVAILLSSLLSACGGPSFAPDSREALVEQVEEFNQATVDRDFETIIAMLAPRVINELAAQSALTNDEFIEQVASLTEESMADIELTDFEISVPEGAPTLTEEGLSYAVLPTSVEVLESSGIRAHTDESTLAIYDVGGWSLTRVQGADQEALLFAVYPELVGVDVSPEPGA